jgi:hypothetical protein
VYRGRVTARDVTRACARPAGRIVGGATRAVRAAFRSRRSRFSAGCHAKRGTPGSLGRTRDACVEQSPRGLCRSARWLISRLRQRGSTPLRPTFARPAGATRRRLLRAVRRTLHGRVRVHPSPLQDRAGKGRGTPVNALEHSRRERCSKACYINCPATSARVHRRRWRPVENARIGRTRTGTLDPSTPAASTFIFKFN